MGPGKEATPRGFLDWSNASLSIDEESPPNTSFFPKRPKNYAVVVTGSPTRPGRQLLQRKVFDCEFEPSTTDFGGSMSSEPSFQSIGNSSGPFPKFLHHSGSGGEVLANSMEKLQWSGNSGNSGLNPGLQGVLGSFAGGKPGYLSQSSNTLVTSPSQLPLDSEHSGGSGFGTQLLKQRPGQPPAIILPNGSLSARSSLSRTATPALSSSSRRVKSQGSKRDDLNNTSSSIQTAISEPLNRLVQSARKHVTALRPNVGKPFVLPFGRNQQNGRQPVRVNARPDSSDARSLDVEDLDQGTASSTFRRDALNYAADEFDDADEFDARPFDRESSLRSAAGDRMSMYTAGGRVSAYAAGNRVSSYAGHRVTSHGSGKLQSQGSGNRLQMRQTRTDGSNRLTVSAEKSEPMAQGRIPNTRKTESSVIAKAQLQAQQRQEEEDEKNDKKKNKQERASWFEEFQKTPSTGSKTFAKSHLHREEWEMREIWGDAGKQEVDSGVMSQDTESTGWLIGLAKRLGLEKRDDKFAAHESILRKLRPKNCKKMRMQNMRECRKVKNRAGRRKAARPTEISLPAEEVIILKEAFQRYDEDSSGDLDLREVNEAFQDLGLKPKTQDEKIEFGKILEELAGDANGGGLMFPEFCAVVQTIRQKIQDSQTAVLFSVFQNFDEDASGFLDKDEVLRILGELQIAPTTEQEEEAVLGVMDDVTEGSDHPGQVGFAEFQIMIIKVRETLQGLRRAREREIRDQHNLDPDTFAGFRPELISLYTAFCRYDSDGSGKLDIEETRGLLAQFGLLPRCKVEQEEMERLLLRSGVEESKDVDDDDDPEFDFPAYLQLISRLRSKVAADKRDELQEVFAQYDKDHSGDLSMREVSLILLDLGLQPKTRGEQEEIQHMMEDVDEDGSESCDFEEFCVLFQRISEKLQAMQREAERRKALELNYTLHHLADLRQSFETLDRDGNGVLEIGEIRRALQLLRKRIPSDTLRELFDEVDVDGSGVLEFQEFLVLMRKIDDNPELQQMSSLSLAGHSTTLAQIQGAVKDAHSKKPTNTDAMNVRGDQGATTEASQALARLSKKNAGGGNAKPANAQVFLSNGS